MSKAICGKHAIEEWIKAHPGEGTLLIAKRTKRNTKLEEYARSQGTQIGEASEREIENITDTSDHRGAALQLPYHSKNNTSVNLKEFLKQLKKEKSVVLVLDSITDPHNYGAILRSADLFGVDLVIRTERRSAKETETVARTSAGAIHYVPLCEVTNLARSLEELKKEGFWIFGADMDGEPCRQADLRGRTCIVMGREGAGLHKLIQEKCDMLISIPTKGHVDSLNVSVATGVLLYETHRQNM